MRTRPYGWLRNETSVMVGKLSQPLRYSRSQAPAWEFGDEWATKLGLCNQKSSCKDPAVAGDND